ncbi:MAG: acyltransferase [Candidatus Omnitrophica bacterium CG11_big_fil_rev_8_21_14_0_20_45_26]|uniref:Acyltransferase n=1 Tax=Candidatus Abzuiibacterium crystallinum TaxID=1974748 RepID=A0A2H0LQG6_9BACT|nr:MAG: acyltransferase [Candidatus Omnitrophica bacterium CG11_big_fil_rev_8_21_14_0_20_45_26]PIW63981.1 MAG: acyltransferase [Candidatus Omnitrophica bacterium CG12_big_fil_rev_8_21_14_0_65_45_16]
MVKRFKSKIKKRQKKTPPSSSVTSIGLLQLKTKSSPHANLAHIEQKIDEAALRGAKIICLQELCHTIYFPQYQKSRYFDFAVHTQSLFIRQFQYLAREYAVVLIVPFFEKKTDVARSVRGHAKRIPMPGETGVAMTLKSPRRTGYYNSVAVIDADGQLLGIYRKMHIPDDPYFYEKFYFTPGNLGFKVFQTRYANIGVLICWDQWFPEAARLASLQGADILFYPTAIGWHQKTKTKDKSAELNAWQTIQRSHAIANGVFVAAVNRVGREDQLTFWGSSFVADPFGEVIQSAGRHREEIVLATCPLSLIRETRKNWPFWRDRRVDAYQKLNLRLIKST